MISKYTAIIIEPRKHQALSFVLNNFLENLSDEWNIIVFHGNNNHSYLLNIIENQLKNYVNRIKLINLGIQNLTINDYNNLLKSRKIYDFVPTETFMIFQTDTMIIPKYKHYINYFLKYDYVGAPWINKLVGNGGLSIRKKTKMLQIINNPNRFNLISNAMNKSKNEYVNEDYFFSLNNKVRLSKPRFHEAKLFSMEQVFSEKGSFGIHKAWKYIDIELLKTHCPDILTLKNLQ
jgi:hypothetical protein